MVGGIDPTPRRILLESKSRVRIIIELERGEKSDPLSHPSRQSRLMEHQGHPPEKSPTSIDMGGRVDQDGKVHTHPAVDEDQTIGRGDATDGYFDGHKSAANKG